MSYEPCSAALALKSHIDETRGISHNKAAEEMGVAASDLSTWLNGVYIPSPPKRLLISRWSKGAVRAKSWPKKKPVRLPYRPVLGRVCVLPMMHPGTGERRDCRRESECLGNFLRSTDAEFEAVHCPNHCKYFDPIPGHVRVAMALIGAQGPDLPDWGNDE